MNVRIFWVRAMKCMCAQTRPRFILSSEGVLGGMEFEPMLTPREKSPLPENVPRGGSNPWHRGQRAHALPTELFRPPAQLLILAEVKWHEVLLSLLWLKLWTDQGREESGVPGKKPNDNIQKMPRTKAWSTRKETQWQYPENASY